MDLAKKKKRRSKLTFRSYELLPEHMMMIIDNYLSTAMPDTKIFFLQLLNKRLLNEVKKTNGWRMNHEKD